MVDYYPPWGFYFKVVFNDISKDKNDVRFQSVSGLSVEYDYESFKEGGENRFEHKLPVRTKYSDLVLKRGMLVDSSVIKWVIDAFQNRSFKPATITVTLMNEKSEPCEPGMWHMPFRKNGSSAISIRLKTALSSRRWS